VMPHIKVKPISSEILETIDSRTSIVQFRADPLEGEDCLLGVEWKGESFLLQLKRGKTLDMLKYDKVTRPLKVNLIKETLASIAEELELEILHSNIAQSAYRAPLASAYFKKIGDFESIEYPFDRMAIEVGFGSGRHLLHQAREHPDRLHIGIEIHTPSAQQLLRQIELQELKNIWVLNYDARLFLEMLPSNSCERIFVHFPVPWDKKPHRRVISEAFTAEAIRVLEKGGTLELRTDSEKYFWYSMETFFDLSHVKLSISKNSDAPVTSKYEARWKRQEKNIYEVHLRNEEDSDEREEGIEFDFDGLRYFPGLEARIPGEPYKGEGYFVHFERVYRIGKHALLVKCAFGSFDRPEHKYIMIDQRKSGYYASTPVKTRINYRAHQKIMEYLHVN